MNEATLPRIKIIRLSLPMLARLLVQGRCWQVAMNGLPDDAVVIGAWFDQMRDCWCLKVQSQSYPQAPPGEVYMIDPSPTVVELNVTAPVSALRDLV